MGTKKIIILGSGITGLTLAYKLLWRNNAKFEVKIFEKENFTGGLAGSFSKEGLIFDYGSHRIHPSCGDVVLGDLKNLLCYDLKLLRRNGRIHLINNFVKFPFTPKNFIFNANPVFFINCVKDFLTKFFRKKIDSEISFVDIVLNSFGPALCNSFYFPYAEKIWGLSPCELSAYQAKKRISSNSFIKIVKNFYPLSSARNKKFCFYYPRLGMGQLAQNLSAEIKKLGGSIELNRKAEKLVIDKNKINLTVRSTQNISDIKIFTADFVFSTIALPSLINIIEPKPPEKIKSASNHLRYRSMVLFYLILKTPRFTEYDAHYIPDKNIIFTRISEPKNYNLQDNETTGLCIEIPCFYNGETWNSPEHILLKTILSDFRKINLPIDHKIIKSFSKKIRYAYPLYDLSFQDNLDQTEIFLDSLDNIISLGRQGLFAHDNIHHAMQTAYKANDCLNDNIEFDKQTWVLSRNQFKNHKVQD
ncbi:FAD-dependent oxidoreductase [bacterium]|nr:FAD-dependent oxidoreductase [bacterium]